jgi:hypothetical protein
MAALNDYVCMAHGPFESRTGVCPHGCGKKMVQLVFNKAPGMVSGRTKNIDSTLRGLAQEHGLTDMNNKGGTEAVFRPDPNFNKAQDNLQRQMMSGQTYAGDMASGENAISQVMNSGGFQPDNALESVKPLLTKPKTIVHAKWDGK